MARRQVKGQVTTFIVIGIIILLGIILYLIFANKQITSSEGQAAEVPTEFSPLNEYIESCIAKVGKEGIQQIGYHGGYIDLQRYGLQPKALNPTQGNAFLLNPQDPESGVAYWQYFKSDNECEVNCECGTEQPVLKKEDGGPSVEKQLEDYIVATLPACLNDFSSFKRQGYQITAPDSVKAGARVREEDVLFLVEYPVEATIDGATYTIKEYSAAVPVMLPRMFDAAQSVVAAQRNYTYLEKWTMELISGFGLGIDQNRLPPIAASELDPFSAPTYWVKYNVISDIQKNVLPQYIPFLTVLGSRNFNSNVLGTFYERAIVPVSSEAYDYSGLDVSFKYYTWWNPYIDITGRGIKGERIGPESASSSLFSWVGIQRYNFYYDVSYPVIVDVYDPEAFNGEGMHLMYGIETNVRNNRPLNCSGAGITQYATPTGSLFCDPQQACADVTIETVSAKDNMPLDKVTLYYTGGKESCSAGFTTLSDGTTALSASLPQCVGSACALNAVREGYWFVPESTAVRCDSTSACAQDAVLCNGEMKQLKLEPFRNTSVVVMKKKMLKQKEKTWAFNNQAEPLLSNEYVVITLTKQKENINEEDLVLTAVYRGDEGATTFYPGLIPGTYDAQLDLFYGLPDSKGRNVIEFKKVEECTDVLFSEKCTDIGPYNISQDMVEGGFVSTVTLTQSMVDANRLVFYVLSSPDIDTAYAVLDVYDMEEFGKVQEYNDQNIIYLKPTIG